MLEHETNKCPICLEDIDNKTTVLRCKHTFHNECLVDCFLFMSKKHVNRRKILCPICRRGICCSTKRMLLYDTYVQAKQDYMIAQKQSNNAWYRLMKHQFLKYFKKYTDQEAFAIVRDTQVQELKAIALHKKEKYFRMKALYESGCCGRCPYEYQY